MAKTLVVDDDLASAGMCPNGKAGAAGEHEFLFARTDQEAIDILSARDDLDIAIVRVDSERLSGMGLFLRLDAKDARLPRIALSAKPDLELLRQSLKQGASDFLVKPVAAAELAETLDRVYRVCERRRKSWKNETELSAIRREIEIAGEIQRRILPRRFPDTPGLDIFARTAPAKDMAAISTTFSNWRKGGSGWSSLTSPARASPPPSSWRWRER